MITPRPKGPKPRPTTLVFRRFRDKNTALSAMYWTSETGRAAIRRLLDGAAPHDKAVERIGVTFETRLLGETVQQLLARLDQRAGAERLHLLVICSANLEAFLQDAIAVFVAQQGFHTADYKLNPVGAALARPVVGSSTVPDMLEFAEQLLAVKFGDHLTRWRKGYTLRCAAAHNGGVMSEQTARKLGDTRRPVGDHIHVEWQELKDLLESAHAIANIVNNKIATNKLLEFEVEWTLAQWKREQRLPDQSSLWTILHQDGVKVSKPRKKAMELWLYAKQAPQRIAT